MKPSAYLACALSLLALHCHSDVATPPIAGLDDVMYTEGVNDEALAALLAATAVDGKGQGAVLAIPSDATVVSAVTPLGFAWYAGPTARLLRPRPRSWPWPDWMGIAQAHAHGASVSGKAYFLVVSSPANPKVLRVFTKATTFMPPLGAWAQITADPGPLTAVVTTAIFDSGKLAGDGGPFLGKAAKFSIKP